MNDGVSQLVDEILQIENDEHVAGEVVRLYLEGDSSSFTVEVAREVARRRSDIHWRWMSALPACGVDDWRCIDLLLQLLPEIWLHDLYRAEELLRELLDEDQQPSETVGRAQTWKWHARQGEYDERCPGLSTSALIQEE